MSSRSSRMCWGWMVVGLALALAACSKGAPSDEEPAPDPPTPAAEPPAPPPRDPEPTSAEVPITADFEAEARSEIDAENYADVLDALAAEIERTGE